MALERAGWSVNWKRIQRLMRLMGIEGVGPKPQLSQPHPGHRGRRSSTRIKVRSSQARRSRACCGRPTCRSAWTVAAAPGAGVSDAGGRVRRDSCGCGCRGASGMLTGTGRGHVEISQTRFPHPHTLHQSQWTETTGTTLTCSAPETVHAKGSTSPRGQNGTPRSRGGKSCD